MNVNVCLSAFPLLCCIWGSNKGPFLVGCMNYGENVRFHVYEENAILSLKISTTWEVPF